jgi:hypothetical protein
MRLLLPLVVSLLSPLVVSLSNHEATAAPPIGLDKLGTVSCSW